MKVVIEGDEKKNMMVWYRRNPNLYARAVSLELLRHSSRRCGEFLVGFMSPLGR